MANPWEPMAMKRFQRIGFGGGRVFQNLTQRARPVSGSARRGAVSIRGEKAITGTAFKFAKKSYSLGKKAVIVGAVGATGLGAALYLRAKTKKKAKTATEIIKQPEAEGMKKKFYGRSRTVPRKSSQSELYEASKMRRQEPGLGKYFYKPVPEVVRAQKVSAVKPATILVNGKQKTKRGIRF